MLTAEQMQAHVDELAAVHGVTIDYRRSTRPRAWRRQKKIRIAYVKTCRAYALALHELGHVDGRQVGPRIDKEVQAWEWALETAREWTEEMQAIASACLRSYLEWAQRHKTARRPDPDHKIYLWII